MIFSKFINKLSFWIQRAARIAARMQINSYGGINMNKIASNNILTDEISIKNNTRVYLTLGLISGLS